MPPDLIKLKTGPSAKHLALNVSGSFFFFISVGVFVIVTGAYGGFFLLNRNFEQRAEGLTEDIRMKETELRNDLKNIFLVESRLKNLKTLIEAHRMPSKIIAFLEETTLKSVRFASLALSVSERKLNLVAETENFVTLAQQISLLERHPNVTSVEFGGLSLSPRGVVFTLQIIFQEEIFHNL